MRKLGPAALLLLAACAGPKPQSDPVDVTMERETRAALLAFRQGHPDEAAIQYRRALLRAEERDDAQAIGDVGYNLAVAELAANRPQDALATAQAIVADGRRRGITPSADLDLVVATARYRTGDKDSADALAMRVQRSGDLSAADRASLLRGIIADERADMAGLETALATLDRSGTGSGRADVLELQARMRLVQGDAKGARAAALYAADLWRNALDYRGVARALAVAAAAAVREGDDAMSADLYLRAGRSAARQGDTRQARIWLAAAKTQAADPMLRKAVEAEIAGLK